MFGSRTTPEPPVTGCSAAFEFLLIPALGQIFEVG